MKTSNQRLSSFLTTLAVVTFFSAAPSSVVRAQVSCNLCQSPLATFSYVPPQNVDKLVQLPTYGQQPCGGLYDAARNGLFASFTTCNSVRSVFAPACCTLEGDDRETGTGSSTSQPTTATPTTATPTSTPPTPAPSMMIPALSPVTIPTAAAPTAAPTEVAPVSEMPSFEPSLSLAPSANLRGSSVTSTPTTPPPTPGLLSPPTTPTARPPFTLPPLSPANFKFPTLPPPTAAPPTTSATGGSTTTTGGGSGPNSSGSFGSFSGDPIAACNSLLPDGFPGVGTTSVDCTGYYNLSCLFPGEDSPTQYQCVCPRTPTFFICREPR